MKYVLWTAVAFTIAYGNVAARTESVYAPQSPAAAPAPLSRGRPPKLHSRRRSKLRRRACGFSSLKSGMRRP